MKLQDLGHLHSSQVGNTKEKYIRIMKTLQIPDQLLSPEIKVHNETENGNKQRLHFQAHEWPNPKPPYFDALRLRRAVWSLARYT